MITHFAALAQTAMVHAGSTTSTTINASAHQSFYSSILSPIAKPIASVLAAIYSIIPNYGVAIMALSLIWMIIISPLTLKSTRSMLAMQKLQPQLKRLQAEHKNDRQAFAQAQMELFREHNVSPFGSCLPMLLPLPIFFALFEVINGLSRTINHVPVPQYLSSSTQMYKDIVAGHGQLNAFAMDLAKNPFSPHSGFMAALPYWVILVIMAGTSYLQSAQMMSRNPQAQSNPQMRLMKYLPLLFVVFCIRFPAGVILYYIVSNLCRIGQQYAMYRWDPKVRTLVAKEVIEVEEITRDIDERQKDRTNRPGYTPPRSVRGAGAGSGGPKGGSGGSGGTKSGSGASSGGGSGGRSRFRDLLAAAAEQQKTQQEAREAARATGGKGGGGTKALGSGGTQAGGNQAGGNQAGGNQAGGTEGRNGRNGNGSASTGRPAPTQSGGRPPGARNLPAGRSNRKKRGR